MSLKHATASTNVVRDAHYVRNPVTGKNERALLVEPALTNVVEFNIPGGTAADVELQKLDAITNLDSEYGVVVPVAPGYYVPMPANFDPDEWCVPIFSGVQWDSGDGAAHIFGVIYADANNYIEWGKDSSGDLYCTVVANGTTKTATLTKAIAAGSYPFFGARLYSGTLTVYADTDGDSDVTDNTATATSVPASTGASWNLYPGRNYAGTAALEGSLNLLLTNDGSDASAITDRFNGGAGMALGGDMGWLAQVSGNGSRHGENLVLHVGGNADGSSYQLDTAHNATDLLAGTATGRVDLPPTTGHIRFGNTAEFNGATKVSLMWEFEIDAAGVSQPLFRSDASGGVASSLDVLLSDSGGGIYVVFDGVNYVRQSVSPVLAASDRLALGVAVDLGLSGTARAKLYYSFRNAVTRKYGTWTEFATAKTSSGTIPATITAETGIHQIGGGTADFKFDTFAWKVGTAHDFTTFDATDIVEPKPWKWDHIWTFDGDGTDLVGGLTATVTGGSYVDDGRHHLGRMERFTRQGQYVYPVATAKLTTADPGAAADGINKATWQLYLTAAGANTRRLRRSDGSDNQFAITETGAGFRVFVASSGSDVVNFVDFAPAGYAAGKKYKATFVFDGTLAAGSRIAGYFTEHDPATGKPGTQTAPTPSVTGTIPTSLRASALGYAFGPDSGSSGPGGFATGGLDDEARIWYGVALTSSEANAESIYAAPVKAGCSHRWKMGSTTDEIGGLTLTVSGAIPWYDGRQVEGWTNVGLAEIDRATGSNQSSEGTYGVRLKGDNAGSDKITKTGASLTVGRWVVVAAMAREVTGAALVGIEGSGAAFDAAVPTQATLAAVGASGRATGTGSAIVRAVSQFEAYIDNLRALQLATVSLSVSASGSSLPAIDGKGGAWGVLNAASVAASSEGIPLPYSSSLGTTIVKLTSGPAGSGTRRYVIGLPGEMNGFTAGQVGVCLVGVYIPASSEVGYADVKIRAVDSAGNTQGTAAPGDGDWHWLWVARKWDAGATEAYFEVQVADGVALSGANEVVYMSLPSAVQGAGIGAPIANAAEGSTTATGADATYATAASASISSRTYYLRLFEVGTALAGGTIYHLGSSTAGEDPRLVVEGVNGYYRVTLDDGSEEITSTATVAPTPGQIVELRVVVDATAKTVRIHQAINHGTEVSATVSSALSGSMPTAFAGTRRYFGSEANTDHGALCLLNEVSFAGDVAVASCRAFAGV